MAVTMNSPAQLIITRETRVMILAWEEAGVFGEKESCVCVCVCVCACVVSCLAGKPNKF